MTQVQIGESPTGKDHYISSYSALHPDLSALAPRSHSKEHFGQVHRHNVSYGDDNLTYTSEKKAQFFNKGKPEDVSLPKSRIEFFKGTHFDYRQMDQK